MESVAINLPFKGQLLRVKTSSKWIETPTYLSGHMITENTDRAAFVQDISEADDAIWIYDGVHLVNYANGLTLADTGGNYPHATIGMYPTTTTVAFQAAQNGTVGKYNLKFAGNRYAYTNNNLYTDAGGSATDEGYNFELIDATTYFFLNFSDAGWATGYFPIDVAANPEYGIEAAYVVTSEVDGVLKVEEAPRLIPAFTPVILKTYPGLKEGFVKGDPNCGVDPIETILRGCLWKMEAPENAFVLAVDTNPFFAKYKGEYLNPCKAYYQAPAGSAESALRISFGEDILTGVIETIEQQEFSGDIYDLQGRRISGVQSGVFVKNGKKVIK